MLLVAILTVRREALAGFRAYEAAAAAIMDRHGGSLERAIVLRSSDDATVREVHLVRFPDEAALAAYRADPELVALAPQRDAAVIATEVMIGDDGPDYRPRSTSSSSAIT
jgi:uncharacterized protein (DUF1330 family)